MKKLILNIAILTVVMILANNFTTSAQTSKGNTKTTSTETTKTVKENNTKDNNKTSSVKTNKTNKPVKKHTFFLHFNNIVIGNGQFA